MARWLFKEEPSEYSFADLLRDGETTWEGVSNALALKHLRSVRPGDEVLYYHTGKEKAVVGVMQVKDITDDDGSPIVTVVPVRRFQKPVTLSLIKSDPQFANWELARISRLSVMPVTDAVWKRIEKLAGMTPETSRSKKKSAG
jgi:predicted RNA-binding protein with PUA-like domain